MFAIPNKDFNFDGEAPKKIVVIILTSINSSKNIVSAK